MYIPTLYRESQLDVLHALVREHSFGTLVSQVNGELCATHLPFLLDPDRGANGTLVGHMARANPHWQGFAADAECLVMFQGPHAYISPSWYASEVSVPTWNYIAVHAYGMAATLDDPRRVREILEATVRTFEAGSAEPWSLSRVPADYVANMASGIVAFEIPIARLEGKRKLGQNRPPIDVQGAAAGLRARGDPLGLAVAELMSESVRTRQTNQRS